MLFKVGRATAVASLTFRNSAPKICWEVSFVFPALSLIRALIFVACTLVCVGDECVRLADLEKHHPLRALFLLCTDPFFQENILNS